MFNVSIIASAQYSFRISLGVKCQGLNGDYLAKQINDALAAQHNADMFSSLAECESARNAINKNYTTQGCSVSINVSPCVGNGTAGAAGATGSSGSIYKGQSSFYSSNASNEVKDWAQDNDEFFKIIGGTGTESVPAQTVKTGDEGYDKMMQNDLETIEQKQDDRPGFDDKLGNRHMLFDIKAKYLLLVFTNPDCAVCKKTEEAMGSSEMLNSLINKGIVTVLAVCPEDNYEGWLSHAYPQTWINGYDMARELYSNRLYDIQYYPSLYLLDSNKTVLVKESDWQIVELYFKEAISAL